MKLLKHRNGKDIAFTFEDLGSEYKVNAYNINYYKLSGRLIKVCDYLVAKDRVNFSEYEEITI
jgi:hypothetical protein